jgi:hypothetical protein
MKYLFLVCLGLLCTGCASTSFSRYEGTQIAWPISQGSFVQSEKHGADVIHGLPTKPYEVLGFVEGSGMERMNAYGGRSIYSPDVLRSIAKKAKKRGADAIVILSSEREFAGFFNYHQSYTSPTYAFGTATTMGSFTSVNLQSSGATTTGWGYSTPMYERRFSAIAIRYIANYPEPRFLVNGQQMTAEQLREYYYAKNPEQKGREPLVNSVTPWIKWPQSETLDGGLESLASQVREVIKTESQDDMNGTWYGYYTQTTQLANGSPTTGSAHLRVTFTQAQNRIVGNGNLDSGETISLQGDIEGAKISGSVINTASGNQSTFSGTATSQQMTGDFSGAGSGQTFKGVFTIYR